MRTRKLREKTGLGAKIRAVRGKRTQAEFGLLIGQPKSVVSLWETETRKPSTEHLAQIAAATSRDLREFLPDGISPRPESALHDNPGGYVRTEIEDITEAVREIMESGQEVVIAALRANIRAFIAALKMLRPARRRGGHGGAVQEGGRR